jgi:hypothetical protein
MKTLLIILAAVIFSAGLVGGTYALRRLTNVALRGVVFLPLFFLGFSGSLRLGRNWDLNPVELGAAWAVALVVVVIVEATIRVRRRKQVAATR